MDRIKNRVTATGMTLLLCAVVTSAHAQTADSTLQGRGQHGGASTGQVNAQANRADSTFSGAGDGGASMVTRGTVCPPGKQWGAPFGVTDCVAPTDYCTRQALPWQSTYERLRCEPDPSKPIYEDFGGCLTIPFSSVVYCWTDWRRVGYEKSTFVRRDATVTCQGFAPPQDYPLATYLAFKYLNEEVVRGVYNRYQSDPISVLDMNRGAGSMTVQCVAGSWAYRDNPPVCPDDPNVAPSTPC